MCLKRIINKIGSGTNAPLKIAIVTCWIIAISSILFICGSFYIWDSTTYWDRGYSILLHTNSTHYEMLDTYAVLNFSLGVGLALAGVVIGVTADVWTAFFQLATSEEQCKK